MIKRKKPLLRKTPLKRSQQPLKRTAIKHKPDPKTGKFYSIKKKSVKQSKKDREYSKVRNEWIVFHPYCARCSKESTDVHHKKGRGIYLMAVEYWVAVCRECHTWIENNPNEAKSLGFSINRL